MASSPPPSRPAQSPAPSPPGTDSPAATRAQSGPGGHHVPIWLQRLSLFTFVLFCMVVGMTLVVLPWTSQWTDHTLLARWPGLRAFLQQGFVRGAVSGLGLLDLWFGIWEALHYREAPHP
ncbi:MAG TPA: hypothetical protein VEG08_04035 [Terriglobales bacterium]|nr:hypothetical protein [Terriglobales bacterium]